MRSNSKNKARRANNRNRELGQYIDPPRFQSITALTRRYRWTANSSFNASITQQDLLLSAGMVCTVVNTTCVPLAAAFRLHRISVWGCPGTAAAASTVSVRWVSASNSPSKEVSNTAMTTSRPAYLTTRPPAGSSAWFELGYVASIAVFGLTVPAGGVVEIDITHWFYDTGSAAVFTQGVAAGTLGVLYFGRLDQSTTNVLIPSGLPSTA